MDPKAIQAKAPEASSGSGTVPRKTGAPDRLLSEIRRKLKAGEIRAAKRLAAKAVQDHRAQAEILDIHRILNEGRSSTSPATGRDMRLEYERLRIPHEKYRGQWVALVGDKVVGSAATPAELQETLPSDLDQTPLAIRIPS